MENTYFSLKDVIKITKLSERTIRRYLTSGLLHGSKVGGQWRFTEKQIKKFFKDQSFVNDIAKQASKEVKTFLEHNYDDTSSDKACTIIDFNEPSAEKFEAIKQVVMTKTKEHTGFKMKLHPEGNYVRVVLIGSIDFIIDLTNALNNIKDYD